MTYVLGPPLTRLIEMTLPLILAIEILLWPTLNTMDKVRTIGNRSNLQC